MNAREEATELVRKIAEAERLGGGFRTFHELAIEMIAKLIDDNRIMKARCDAMDAVQRTTVQR